jgi:sugar lactone lactonase YvrE
VGLGYGPEGSIYVADTWNGRIQNFTDSLLPLSDWQVDAWYSESINNKPYVTVDGSGRVFVTDPEGYRVLVFDSAGEYLGRFGQYSLDDSGFGLPIGIAVDQDGFIYIADSGNNRILKFAPFPGDLDQDLEAVEEPFPLIDSEE